MAGGRWMCVLGLGLGLSLSAMALAQDDPRSQDGPDGGAGGAGGGDEARAVVNDDAVSFAAFTEPVELTTLVDMVGEILAINVVIKGDLSGSVVFNAPVEVPRSELLNMLDGLLEQWDFTITRGEAGLYTVLPVGDIRPTRQGERATTRVISCPNVKPTLLQTALDSLLGTGGGGVQGGASSSGARIAYLDELGVIVATAPPLTLDRLSELVETLLEEYEKQEFTRIELTYIAAPVARERANGLVGGGGAATGGIQNLRNRQAQQQNANQIGGAATGGSLDNLGDRLAIDPGGNALIFRGTPEELEKVREILAVIDVPNTLEPKNYYAGSSALQIADIASQRGLGEVIVKESASAQNTGFQGVNRGQNQLNQLGGGTEVSAGGPAMVVDVDKGSILYYGTSEQQDQLAGLLKELGTEDERIVIREYKLHHAVAEDVAALIDALITGQSPGGDSPLLPGSGQATAARTQAQPAGQRGAGGGDGEIGAFDPDLVFVVADTGNNQVIVKAPIKQQSEFAKLIERIDLRRPQVYIEATIISVADNSNLQVSVESQIVSGQFGAQSNFGLSSANESGLLFPRTVATGLSGLTTAVIRSNYVPVIVNAVKTDSDSRIISAPTLLVNDNEEARIVSLEQQPTTQTSQGDATTQTSFAGFEDAGTTLEVTPSISEAGFLRLDYRVELSNFIGTGSDGIPAPRQNNEVEGQVTIPSDATIVVGGIKVDNIGTTKVRLPLVGEIPLLGMAFGSTGKTNNSSTLYVFITPRIMTDPNFYDLKLLSRGPQAEMEVPRDIPELLPAVIRFHSMPRTPAKLEEPTPVPAGDEPVAGSAG